MEALFADAKFWVGVSLIFFLSLLIYLRVPKMVLNSLDERSREIAEELEKARQLRDDAQAMLAEYQRKQQDAEREAEDIIERANAEAERLAKETETAIQQQLERRTKLAEQKIAQAEARALGEVRAVAADVAVGAAQRILTDRIDENSDANLIQASIGDVERMLKSAR
jgi:F-type H+-transporting ATPase subunit b